MRAGRGECPRVKTTSVFMRKVVLCGLASVAPLVGLAATAAASSIVAVAPPQATPSIVSMGEATPAPVEAKPATETAEIGDDDTEILAIGNSVVAIGADAIPPSHEEVAAIAEPATAEPDMAESEMAESEMAALPGWLADGDAPALRGGIAPQE